jgi:hypothetical protein
MTKNQKQKHTDLLKRIVLSKGFSLDRWGNYVKENEKVVFRIKMMKNNLRFEWKDNKPKSTWFNVFSKPIVRIDSDYLNGYLQERTK